MYFYNRQDRILREKYTHLLSVMGAFSNLFSSSKVPYLDSRVAENVFCRSLEAENISRQDCTADAKKGKIGIGIKTYIDTSKLQKIAEFNKNRATYINLKDEELIYKISTLRNERICFTKRTHNLDYLIYHCITRKNNKFIINESYIEEVDLNTLELISKNQASIKFKDKYNEYSFNLSKSVLMKQFKNMEKLKEIDIIIIDDPYILLENCFKNNLENYQEEYYKQDENYIILPLYSYNKSTKNKEVSAKSGLNQWNAGGRKRDPNEIYIPISRQDHKVTPNFFPDRDTEFRLLLPNGKDLSAKICQDNNKALMSNPNKELGEWLLRDVLNLKEKTLVTYEKLEDLGIDSVRIDKIKDLEYKITFSHVGTYEEFIEKKQANIELENDM